MSQKAARGTKRTCQSCSSRFYDLNRDPITCPICGAMFAVETGDYRAGELLAAEELEPLKAKAVVPPELMGEEADLPEIESTDELAAIEAAEDDTLTDEDDATFLEEEEEGETDVSGLLDGPVEGEDEEG